jgi:hypothetical protein
MTKEEWLASDFGRWLNDELLKLYNIGMEKHEPDGWLRVSPQLHTTKAVAHITQANGSGNPSLTDDFDDKPTGMMHTTHAALRCLFSGFLVTNAMDAKLDGGIIKQAKEQAND